MEELVQKCVRDQGKSMAELSALEFLWINIVAALRSENFHALTRTSADQPLPLLASSGPLIPYEQLGREQTRRGHTLYSVHLSHVLAEDTVIDLTAMAVNGARLVCVGATPSQSTRPLDFPVDQWVHVERGAQGEWRLKQSADQLLARLHSDLIQPLVDGNVNFSTSTSSSSSASSTTVRQQRQLELEQRRRLEEQRQRQQQQQQQQQQQPHPFSIGQGDVFPGPVHPFQGERDGNLIGPNHPGFGQTPGARFGQRYDPIGYGEPNRDHLQPPGFGRPDGQNNGDDREPPSGYNNLFL